MAELRLSQADVQRLEAETDLTKRDIMMAFAKFKKLAGQKGYVCTQDLKPIIGDVPIYAEVCQAFSTDGKVDFPVMLDMIIAMSEESRGSVKQRKLLFRVYD